MLPTLADGDEVEVRLCEGDEARVGDVVLVLQGTVTVLHRVIGRDGDRLVTQGDGVRFPDDPVDLPRVLGVANLPRRALFSRFRGARRFLLQTRASDVFRSARKRLRSRRGERLG